MSHPLFTEANLEREKFARRILEEVPQDEPIQAGDR
jgi:hypothetical protein